MKLKSIKEVKNLKNRKVLLRVDFNVPIKNGRIIDDFRIKSGLPTIKYLLNKGAGVIILNHLGRPKGKVAPELSNKPVAQKLSRLLNKKVDFIDEVLGPKAKTAVKNLAAQQLIMIENVRFHPREEKNCKKMARSLASYGDLFVNDAFAVCHRNSATVEAIAQYLPSFAGLLLESEVENLSKVLESEINPRLAVIGGAKLETKVKVIKNLLNKMDTVLLGGAIANNVLKQMNYEVGLSMVDETNLDVAGNFLKNKLKIPVDVVTAKSFSAKAKNDIKAVGLIGKKDIILDIGPDTVEMYLSIIKKAKLIVWNGPLGYFEVNKYKKASSSIAKAVASSKAETIIGGGETIQLVESLGLKNKYSFVSTAGGAMLEFLEGKVLPGIKPLIRK